MLCSRPPQAGHLKPSGHRDATITARHCSSLPYCRSNAGSLSPFWNCTALRAISIPPPKALVCSWFVPYPGRLSKVRNQERFCVRAQTGSGASYVVVLQKNNAALDKADGKPPDRHSCSNLTENPDEFVNVSLDPSRP